MSRTTARLFARLLPGVPGRACRVTLRLAELEQRTNPSRPLPYPVVFAGAETGAPPVVKAFDAETGAMTFERVAFEDTFTGGVRVGTADFTRDGYPDLVVGAGSGGGPRVRILDGKTGEPTGGPLADFFAFDPAFRGGASVAAGDVTGDGRPDLVAAAGPGGGPHVRVFDGATGRPLASYSAYDPDFAGGVSLAVADFTGDGRAEVVVGAGVGGGPRVRVLDALTGIPVAGPLGDFFAADEALRGGAVVGADALAGDVDGDGRMDLAVGSGAGEAGRVTVYSGATGGVIRSFSPFGDDVMAGVRVGLAYVTDDAYADVVVGSGPGVPGRVRVFDGQTGQPVAGRLGDFAPFPGAGGVVIAASNDPPAGGVVYSNSFQLVGRPEDGTATVNMKVEQATEGGQYKWTYTLTNTSMPYNDYEPYVATNQWQNFSVYPNGANTGITSQSNDRKWYNGSNYLAGSWDSREGAVEPADGAPLLFGQVGNFRFTTPPVAIVKSAISLGNQTYGVSTTEGKGPAWPTVSLSMPEFVPVNANNDNSQGQNWKPNTSDTIPATRDFAAPGPYAAADPQLQKVTLTAGGGVAGTLSLTAGGPTGPVPGAVRFWEDAKKSKEFVSVAVPAAGVSKEVYVEGVHESFSAGEILVQANFAVSDSAVPITVTAKKQVAVTPILNSLTVAPLTATPTPYFTPGRVGSATGITTGAQGKDAAGQYLPRADSQSKAMELKAEYVTGGMSDRPMFVQVVTGFGKTPGAASAIEVSNGDKYDIVLPVGFDINDSAGDAALGPVPAVPYYQSIPDTAPTPNPTGVRRIKAWDTPFLFINPGAGNELKRMDVTFKAKTYAVWVFGDGSLYSLGHRSWESVLAGDLTAGVFTIRGTAANTPGSLVRSNDDPTALTTPTYNSVLTPAIFQRI